MVVQHNMNALNAYNKLNANVTGLRKSSEKLSSGYRINRAGDDAAGLAISEKMRSQIRGLNQAVRNSQDGINMIQTFEGAAQETHSILQRMKELASESANGTYDNATDRAAIQLEFEQLNDELNQIADTDFNGTIVLNGGEMADGLKQVDGEFDYRMKAGQVADENAAKLAAAQADAQKNIDNAQKAYDSAFNKYNAIDKRDLCLDGTAPKWNTVDNSQYTKDAANTLFANIKYADGTTGGTDAAKDNLTSNGIESIEVTYTYDETNGWAITGGSFVDNDGKTVEIAAAALTDVIKNVTTTDNGGFIAGADTAPVAGSSADATYGNAVLATSDIKTGDVVTLTYTNSSAPVLAPTNIGIDHDSLVNNDKIGGTAVPTLKLDAGITEANLTEETVNALDKLDKAEISFDYSASGINASISDNDLLIASTGTDGEYQISYKDHNGDEVKLATVTTVASHGSSKSNKAAYTPGTAGDTVNAAVDLTLEYKVDSTDATKTGWYNGNTKVDLAADSITIANRSIAAGELAVTGTPEAGDKITVAIANGAALSTASVNYVGQNATVGTIKFGVALDEGKWNSSGTTPTINPSTTTDETVSTSYVAIDKAFEDAKAALDAAKAAYPKTVDDLGDMGGVTKADAYDNSTARMTYTDNITLQTGARTKDAVNFTFKYNTDDTADMGTLKANLNLSAREDGLNTASLSLAT
ncbi:MAG: hypothetical protein K2N06_08945, partial [Oscillospiraceae bacterium]|nr:hypothetical protein [Oscillospiraceae bacterium]